MLGAGSKMPIPSRLTKTPNEYIAILKGKTTKQGTRPRLLPFSVCRIVTQLLAVYFETDPLADINTLCELIDPAHTHHNPSFLSGFIENGTLALSPAHFFSFFFF